MKIKNAVVLGKYSTNAAIVKSHHFYEHNNTGGNTNIWGGYINLKKWNNYLKKNKKFSIFFSKNKYFTTCKISDLNCFKDVGYLQNIRTKSILRLNRSFFKNFINFDLRTIEIKKQCIYLRSSSKLIKAKKINLCVGNLGLIKVLKNSNLVKDNDIVSYEDGKVKYFFNVNLDHKKYYYIPMSLRQIFEKLLCRSNFYKPNENNKNLFVQGFNKKKKIFRHSIKELLNSNISFHRGLTSNHIANLKINNVPIKKFLYIKSNRIEVNCSGTCKKYIPGSISQDLIYNSYLGSKYF